MATGRAPTAVTVLRVPDRAVSAALLATCWEAGTATWVTDPDASRGRLERTGGGWFDAAVLDDLLATGRGRVELPIPSDTATVVTSSGTTGTPKILPLSATALDASADGATAHLGLTRADRWLLVLPLHHVAGQSVVWRAARLGHDPVVQDHVEPGAAAEAGVTMVSLVPTQLRRLVDGGHHLDATVLLGGGAISPSLLADVATGGHVRRVVRSYGLTETSGGCVHDGWPLRDVEVATVDGRLRLRGPVLASGRLTSSGLVPIVDDDGWLATNDLGRIGPDGEVAVVGRADDVVISGGVNVDPAAVEVVLEDDPTVARAGVVGRRDDEWGEVVVAVVTAAGGSVHVESLQARVREHLGVAAVPRQVTVVDALPLTALGKVDRSRLRARTDLRAPGK